MADYYTTEITETDIEKLRDCIDSLAYELAAMKNPHSYDPSRYIYDILDGKVKVKKVPHNF